MGGWEGGPPAGRAGAASVSEAGGGSEADGDYTHGRLSGHCPAGAGEAALRQPCPARSLRAGGAAGAGVGGGGAEAVGDI